MQILILLLISLLSAVSVGSACPGVTTAADPASRIVVVFVQPQHFTDVRYSKAEPNSVALLSELHTFMCKMGERYVPAGMQLEIKVTDIDLAGDFEPWRGPQFGAVRIIGRSTRHTSPLSFVSLTIVAMSSALAIARSATAPTRRGSCARLTTICATCPSAPLAYHPRLQRRGCTEASSRPPHRGRTLPGPMRCLSRSPGPGRWTSRHQS